MKLYRLAPLAFLLSLSAPAQTVPLDVELGYRFTDVTGNLDLYRSQINEREGFLVRSLTWNGEGLHQMSFLDQARLDVSDLGAGPAGSLRFTAGLTGAYRLDLSYRRTEHFSAEPFFANPLSGRGIFPSQHRYDRVRNTFGAELTLLPGGVVSPFVGYERNRYEGPGATTYTLGGDEFLLGQDLSSTDQEFHVGADFAAGMVSGRVMQGWRKYRETQTLSLAGPASGNNLGPVLGQNVTASGISRTTNTDANTPITNALLTIAPISRVKLVGTYVRANAESGDQSQEDSSGSFVSFALSRFFQGLSEGTSADAQSKMWRASGRLELSIIDGLDLTAGYSQRHRTLSGYELISSLYEGTTTFANLDLKDIQQTLSIANSMERTDKVLETRLTAKALGPVSLFVGYSLDKQELSLTEDPEEIVVPGSQDGSFDRKVKRLDAGASFRMAGLFLSGDYQRASADDPITRLDFNSRNRYRLRAGYEMASFVKLTLSGEQIDTKNDWVGIDRDGRMRNYGGDLEVSPLKILHLRVAAFRYQGDNTMTIRLPQNFQLVPSVYSEDGKSFELGGAIDLHPVNLEGSFTRFINHGDLPFTATRSRLALAFDFTKNLGLLGEWARDKYEESSNLPLSSFDANRYGVFLRVHP